MSEYPKLGLDDDWPFKKHKGKATWWVIENDPRYVFWCLNNTALRLDDEALDKHHEIMTEEHGDHYW